MAFSHSPLRYPGGKTFLYAFLTSFLEKNSLQGCDYYEPFAGGSGLALALLYNERVDHIHINDADPAIYAFWHTVLENPEHLISEINRINVNMRSWQEQSVILRRPFDRRNMLALAFATLFMNRTNHSGILSARPIGGLKQTGKWKIDARFNKVELIRKIEKVHSYKSRIVVSNLDVTRFIENVAGTSSGRKQLFYLDPPFYVHGASLYRKSFTTDDHKRLARFLVNSPNWLLSYDDHEEIRSLYRKQDKDILQYNYFANRLKLGRELIIAAAKLRLPDAVAPQRRVSKRPIERETLTRKLKIG